MAFRQGLLTLAFLTLLWGSSQGQHALLQQPLQLEQSSGRLAELLSAIEKQAGIPMAYASNQLNLEKLVRLKGQEKTLGDHLETVLQGEYVRVVVRKGKIILAPSKQPLQPPNRVRTKRFTISGHIQEQGTGEALVGAAVFSPKTGQGTYANAFGFFSLTLPKGVHDLVVQSVGYARKTMRVDLSASQEFQIELESDLEIETVEIQSEDPSEMHDVNVMGRHTLSMEKEGSLPVLLGEADILKTMQLLPGVHGGTDGAAGFYVRGGGQAQNLIHLDGVPIYNANHMLGVVSVFNSAAVKSASIVKGGFPARYSGRLSSLVDVQMKEGNREHFAGEVGMGLLSSRVSLEGPIVKEKASFFVSARRTWLDLLILPVQKLFSGSTGNYFFHDLNAKVNYQVSPKDRIYLSGYTGQDKFELNDLLIATNTVAAGATDQTAIGWGNQLAAFRWNHVFSPKLFSNTTLTYSRYKLFRDQTIEQEQDNNGLSFLEFNSTTEIKDFGGRLDFDYYPNPNHAVKFGIGDIYHTFSPVNNQHRRIVRDVDTSYTEISPQTLAHEAFAYLEDDIRLTNRLRVNLGVHLAGYFVNQTNYLSLQPRVSARYILDPQNSLKLSAGRMVQFVHLLTNTGIGLPSDLWVPSTDKLRPSEADQLSLGYYRTLTPNINLRTEVFYKRMRNLLEYEEGYNYIDNSQEWEDRVEVGKGWSYGVELMLEKHSGDLTGWLSYTLSRTERQFENLNFGKPFPFRYDRRHDLNMALNYRLNQKVSFGAVWIYGTGNAVTFGVDSYNQLPSLTNNPATGQVVAFDQRNNFRTPPYHRLDLSINLDKKIRWGERRWSFGLYNAYNRINPSFLFAQQKVNGQVGIYKQGLLPLVPLVAYRIRF